MTDPVVISARNEVYQRKYMNRWEDYRHYTGAPGWEFMNRFEPSYVIAPSTGTIKHIIKGSRHG